MKTKSTIKDYKTYIRQVIEQELDSEKVRKNEDVKKALTSLENKYIITYTEEQEYKEDVKKGIEGSIKVRGLDKGYKELQLGNYKRMRELRRATQKKVYYVLSLILCSISIISLGLEDSKSLVENAVIHILSIIGSSWAYGLLVITSYSEPVEQSKGYKKKEEKINKELMYTDGGLKYTREINRLVEALSVENLKGKKRIKG